MKVFLAVVFWVAMAALVAHFLAGCAVVGRAAGRPEEQGALLCLKYGGFFCR